MKNADRAVPLLSRCAVADVSVIDRFADALWLENGLSENTLAAYRRDLYRLAAWLKPRQLALVDAMPADLLEFLAEQRQTGHALRSTARLLSSWRRFYRHLVREGRRKDDPTANIESPKMDRPQQN